MEMLRAYLNPKTIGAIIGVIVGILLIWLGPLDTFLIVLFGLVGWLVGKFVYGEIDLSGVGEALMSPRRGEQR